MDSNSNSMAALVRMRKRMEMPPPAVVGSTTILKIKRIVPESTHKSQSTHLPDQHVTQAGTVNNPEVEIMAAAAGIIEVVTKIADVAVVDIKIEVVVVVGRLLDREDAVDIVVQVDSIHMLDDDDVDVDQRNTANRQLSIDWRAGKSEGVS